MLISFSRHRNVYALCCCLGVLLACQGDTVSWSQAELEFQRGRNALAERQYEWARKHFGQVLQLEPEHPEALRLAAVAWLQGPSQSLGTAVEHCRAYLQLDSSRASERAEVQQRLASSLMQLGESAQALEILQTMDSAPEVELLQARLHLSDDPATSLQHSLTQIDHPALGYRALDLVSQAYALDGQTEQAIEAAESSLKRHPLQDKVLYRLSRLYIKQRRLEDAQEAIRRSQQVVMLLDDEGSQTPTERLRHWQEASQNLDPSNLHVARHRAELFLELADLSNVRDAMNILAARQSKEDFEPDLDLQLDWVALLGRKGELEEGEAVLARLLETHGEDRRVRYRWVNWLISTGRLEEGKAFLQESRSMDPYLARFRVAEAELALREERRSEGVEALEEALHWAPWKPEWRRQLAQLHLDAGNRNAARQVLDAALEAHPILEAMQRQHWPEG